LNKTKEFYKKCIFIPVNIAKYLNHNPSTQENIRKNTSTKRSPHNNIRKMISNDIEV
jgi:hypothetical protein